MKLGVHEAWYADNVKRAAKKVEHSAGVEVAWKQCCPMTKNPRYAP
jgi:hypothetical protein